MTNADIIESRQADRLKPAANCRVADVMTAATLGEVLNISSEGLMLASGFPISEGSILAPVPGLWCRTKKPAYDKAGFFRHGF